MKNILFLDIESDPKTQKVLEIGVVYGNTEYRGSDIKRVLPWIIEAEFVAGHNIVSHDIPILEETIGPVFKTKKIIDTLLWSPLLFANKPYHSINKDYKTYSHRDENNPFLDSKIVIEWLHDFIERFNSLDLKWRSILTGLLQLEDKFQGFLYFNQSESSSEPLAKQVHSYFENNICKESPVSKIIAKYPIELAYSLALIHATDDSIFSKWVASNYPISEKVLELLRFSECSNPNCNFCIHKLNPKRALADYFGHPDFRFFTGDGPISLQERAVRAELKDESFVTIFPTGGGKSLTFQLPALMRGDLKRELTVIISPLVSLMKDQVDVLEARHKNVKAVFISGLLSALEREEAIDRVRNGGAHLLYVSPESLRSNTMLSLLKSRKIARFVIDEAHCFSSWGQDFRVDYLFIGDFIKELQEGRKPIPVSCFTATAKPQVVEDIKNYFNTKLSLDLKEYITRADRVNLKYEVINVEDPNAKMGELIRLIRSESTPAIIYSSRVKTVLSIAASLQKNGINCTYFHGKLDKDQKVKNQNEFMQDKVDVIVATSAFGMGVDKSDVKTVIHFDISDSLENYIQEAGRAGRDDKIQAKCFILFNEEDLNKHFALLQNTKLNQKEIGQIWRAVKNNTKFRDNISHSALELAKEAGWETDVRDLENRVTTCLAALEDKGYLKRRQNKVKLYANSLTIKNIEKAVNTINATSGLTEKQRENCSRVVQRLIKEDECQVDFLANILGLRTTEIEETIQLLRDMAVLGDQKDLTAYIDVSRSSKSSAVVLEKALRVEGALINLIPEYKSQFGIRELNQRIIDSGTSEGEIADIFNVLNWWEKHSFVTKSRVDREKQIYKLKFKVNIDDIKKNYESRKTLAADCLRFLERYFDEQKEEKQKSEFPVEFSILGIKNEFTNSGLFRKTYTQKDIENTLLFLNHIKSIKLEGGFMVFYKRYNLEKIEKNPYRQFTKEDYRKMEEFYAQKVHQIHIVGDYAKKCLENYSSALSFVNDYFTKDYQSFITQYFPGRKIEISRPMTKERFHKLFDGLDAEQLNIVRDNSDKILITAGPGSGKTEVLVRKIASLLTLEDIKPEQFLMLTFSKSAALEFKSRVNKLIPELGRFIKISTFHGFCFEIMGQLGDLGKAGDIIEKTISAITNEEIDITSIINKSVLLLDEFQDVNKYEWDLIKAIRDKAERIRVIAVGDDDQNIYEFRGSNIDYMVQFMNEPNTKRHDLLVNYRSKDNIVEFNNEFAQNIKNRIKAGSLITAFQKDNGLLKIINHSSNNLIEPLCNSVLKSAPTGTTAILTRTNEQALITAKFLTGKGLNVKVIAGFEGFDLNNLWEFRVFDTLLDQKKYSGGILPLEVINESKNELEKILFGNPLLPACLAVIGLFIDKLGPRYTLAEWRQYINSIKIEDALIPRDSVIFISTIHKAKGKQFDHVFLLLDQFKPKTDADHRLLYVAMSRAKYSLTIHNNVGIYSSISTDIKCTIETDNNEYKLPKTLELILSHKDVQLGGFCLPKVKNQINKLKTSDRLNYGVVKFNSGTAKGLCTLEGDNILLFSKEFNKKLNFYESKGYYIHYAVIEYIVYWYNPENNEEYKIILPRLILKSTNSKTD